MSKQPKVPSANMAASHQKSGVDVIVRWYRSIPKHRQMRNAAQYHRPIHMGLGACCISNITTTTNSTAALWKKGFGLSRLARRR